MITQLASQAPKINAGDVGIPTVNADNALIALLNTTYVWAGIVAVLVIIIAGYFYVTSGGNPSHTKRAREAIIYSVVGIVVIIMAFAITQFILGRF